MGQCLCEDLGGDCVMVVVVPGSTPGLLSAQSLLHSESDMQARLGMG